MTASADSIPAVVTTPLDQQKAELRKTVLRARAVAHAAGTDAATAIARIGLELALQHRPEVVSAYVPMRDEIDCLPLLDDLARHGFVTAVPVMIAKGEPLVFRQWRPGAPLVAAAFGVSEPAGSAAEATPRLLFVPLAAFDRQGYRLGYGGGFYDRTLARLRAAGTVSAFGLAYDAQQVERVPRDGLDQRLDGVITPTGLMIPEGAD